MSIIASIAELVDLQKDRIDSITYLKIMNYLKEKYDEKEKKLNKSLNKTIEEEEEEEEETMIFYNNEDEDTYASLYK
tara:strand:- start:281 stop:511 length:231 start_codon:yes stop_codon:yes gene_type:complete